MVGYVDRFRPLPNGLLQHACALSHLAVDPKREKQTWAKSLRMGGPCILCAPLVRLHYSLWMTTTVCQLRQWLVVAFGCCGLATMICQQCGIREACHHLPCLTTSQADHVDALFLMISEVQGLIYRGSDHHVSPNWLLCSSQLELRSA